MTGVVAHCDQTLLRFVAIPLVLIAALLWGTTPATASTVSSPPGRPADSAILSIIENWGFDLKAHDTTTKMAGAMKLASLPFTEGSVLQAPINYYGGGPLRPQDTVGFIDPQMTFILPIGSTVRAIATGRVCWVKKLDTGYSDNFSIGIAPTCLADKGTGRGFGTIATREHDHVMSPRAKAGDRVRAGCITTRTSIG